MNQTKQTRIVNIDGAKNIRDLGGLPSNFGEITRFERIYRGDALSRLTDLGLRSLAGLNLESVFDMRHEDEIKRAPDRLPLTTPPNYVRCGFFPSGSHEMFEKVNNGSIGPDDAFNIMKHNYARFPYDHAIEFAAIIQRLLTPTSMPCLIHCTSGKDRTGLISAFILLSVGVPLDAVVVDYEMTEGARQPVDLFDKQARPDTVDTIMSAKADYILSAFDSINATSGSFEKYLEEWLGIEVTKQEILKELLLT